MHDAKTRICGGVATSYVRSRVECRLLIAESQHPVEKKQLIEETAVEYTLFTKLAAEFVGTAVLMVFGNGAVATAELKNTKGYHAGWLNIAMGYGFGVMFPVLMFGGVSGAHINPAMTLAQAVNGMFVKLLHAG